MVIRPGRAPIRSSGGYIRAALRILRSLGTSAHVWLPGANGVSVASLPSNNYLLSDGSTGYSTVDGVDGLTLDAMGALSSTELSTPFDGTYTANTGVVCSGGVLTATAAAAGFMAFRDGTAVSVGKTYLVTGSYSTSSAFTVYLGGTTGAVVSAGTGTFSQYIVAAATSRFQINANNTLTGTINNISIKEYTGTHLTQATTANKPLVRRGAFNWLLRSAEFGHASWVKVVATITENAITAPDGTLTADKIVEVAISSEHGVYQQVSNAAGVLTCSVYLKAAERTWAVLYDGINLQRAWFNLSTGVVGTVQAGATCTMSDAGDGWWRCTYSKAESAASYLQLGTSTGDGVYSFVGDITKGIYAWGAQIEYGTTVSDYTPTTTTAASNPSAGKYWWSFDGSNGALALGSVPFQFSDDFCLHFSAQISAASGNQTIYAATNVAGDRAPWVRFEPTGKVVFQCFQAAGILIAEVQSTATYVGQAIIIRCRKVGSTITLWINGVQVASASTAALTSMGTITTALFGQLVSGTHYYTGALGCSVSVTGTQTDADGLTIDRLLASTFPGAPVF